MSLGDFRIMVQADPFDVAGEIELLSGEPYTDGAICTFIGKVRDDEAQTTALQLEHYPGMTEKALQEIARQASERWNVSRITIIHRTGYIPLGDNIVFVGVTSPHRANAFAACECLMDFLKTKAPFWKKAITQEGEAWVEAKESDNQRASRW